MERLLASLWNFLGNQIIQIALVVGLVYVVIYNFFQKKKFSNYPDYLTEKKSKLDRSAYAKLVNQEIAELKTEIKVRGARGKKEDPKHKERLAVVLSAMLIPLLYAMALYGKYEQMKIREKYLNNT